MLIHFTGYIDDLNGYDFAGLCGGPISPTTNLCSKCIGRPLPSGDSAVNPEYYHGTHVAGLVGAVQNNGIGITGVSPGVKLMILKVKLCGIPKFLIKLG
jgi:subtilisin family serine protease